MSRESKLEELSDGLVATARGVKVLGALSWDQGVADAFLAGFRRGAPVPPPPQGKIENTAELRGTLREIERKCDSGDPIGSYLADTAESYRLVVEMVDQVGTPGFYQLSCRVYGSAGGSLRGSTLCHREAAEQLLSSTEAMACAATGPHAPVLTAETVAQELEQNWAGFFATPISFVVDEGLSAKAAASANRVRLRAGAHFSPEDILQLSAHEVGVHSLTARNGASQSLVRALGLGAPRTTATQEGLATFAELITGAIDLSRLRRIALRIVAIGMVEDGADFVQLFESLVSLGESEEEALFTTMRVFRGADPRGRYPFTKDVVYLKGLFAVHTFLRKAISEHRPELIHRLFVGRLTLGDVLRLDQEFDGLIDPAKYVPTWAEKLPSLAAFLAFSALIDNIDLDAVQLDGAEYGARLTWPMDSG